MVNFRLQPSFVHSNGLMPEMNGFFLSFSHSKNEFNLKQKNRLKIPLITYLYENEDADRDDLIECILFHIPHINTVERLLSGANFVFFLSLNELHRCASPEHSYLFQKVGHIFHKNTHSVPMFDCRAFENDSSDVW